MSQNNQINFVNESRNVVWLSGYAKAGDEGELLLYQSANEGRAIPIKLHAGLKRPRAHTPCEILCHAYGYRDEAGKGWVRLEAVQIKRASVVSVPRNIVALNALRSQRPGSADPYNPFVTLEQARAEIQENLRLDGATIDELLKTASKRANGKDGFVNKAILSGCVGHKAYVPAADDGSGDLGHFGFQLMQSLDQLKAIPVRVTGVDSRFSQTLRKVLPINVVATVAVDAVRDEAQNIIDRRVYLTTDKNNVGYASANDFARKVFPAWWHQLAAAMAEQQMAQRKASEVGVGTSTRAVVAHTPVAAAGAAEVATPADVTVSDETF
ncbi:TPA: hypothetical protein ACKPYM_000769 [Stenotrophomonas maltophilia]